MPAKLKSQLITATTVWDVPLNVSCVWLQKFCGGGGAGAWGTGGVSGGLPGGGGGPPEFAGNLPQPVTPGGTLTITIGAGGAQSLIGGPQIADPGSATEIGFYRAVGGWGGFAGHGNGGPHQGAGSSAGGRGGGCLPGNNVPQISYGSEESPTCFAGSSGGPGALDSINDGTPGTYCEGYDGGIGGLSSDPPNPFAGLGGGGGGASPFAPGGAGGNYNVDGAAGTLGSGGGGGGGLIFGPGQNGSAGGDGAVLLMWIE